MSVALSTGTIMKADIFEHFQEPELFLAVPAVSLFQAAGFLSPRQVRLW